MFPHSWLEFLARERNKKIYFRTHLPQGEGDHVSYTRASADSYQVWYVNKVCGEDSVLSTHRVQPALFRSSPREDFLTVHETLPSPGAFVHHLVLGRLLWQEHASQGPRPVGVGNHHCQAASDIALSHSSCPRTHLGSLMPYIRGNCCS